MDTMTLGNCLERLEEAKLCGISVVEEDVAVVQDEEAREQLRTGGPRKQRE
jgi:hypothetical protein